MLICLFVSFEVKSFDNYESEDVKIKDCLKYLDKGKIKPIIQREFLLSDASEAHKALEKGDHIGKFIMKVS